MGHAAVVKLRPSMKRLTDRRQIPKPPKGRTIPSLTGELRPLTARNIRRLAAKTARKGNKGGEK
jgi:hypothetical protein